MKKLFALLLAIALMATMSVTAFAAEIDQDTAAPQEGSIAVSYQVAPTYTVRNGEAEVAEGDTVLAVNPADGTTGEITLTFVAPTTIQYAGKYEGTVTFTVAVKDAPKIIIINFSLNGESYQAEEGMTLCQWAESEYDVNDEYRDAGDGSVEATGSWGFIEDAVIVGGGEYWMAG